MIRRYLTMAAVVFAIAMFAVPVEADVVFGVDGSATVTAGSTGTLVFFVEATDADIDVHDAGGFTVLYTPTSGGGANAGDLTLGDADESQFVTSTLTTNTAFQPGSYLVQGSNNAPQRLDIRLDLFTVDYSIAANATELGQINIGYDQVQLVDPNSAPIATVIGQGATLTFEAAAIPEPSGLVLLLAGTGLTVLRRRR